MSEKNLLKYLSDNNLKQSDVLEYIKSHPKDFSIELKTQEEIAEDEEKEKTKEEKPKEEEEQQQKDEEETESTDYKSKFEKLLEEIKSVRTEIQEIKAKGVSRKAPSKAKQVSEEDLPEGVRPKIEKNMFEVMI